MAQARWRRGQRERAGELLLSLLPNEEQKQQLVQVMQEMSRGAMQRQGTHGLGGTGQSEGRGGGSRRRGTPAGQTWQGGGGTEERRDEEEDGDRRRSSAEVAGGGQRGARGRAGSLVHGVPCSCE